MAKLIHEAGGHPLINGIEFKPGDDGAWSSGELTDEQLAMFDGVPGYRQAESDPEELERAAKDAADKAAKAAEDAQRAADAAKSPKAAKQPKKGAAASAEESPQGEDDVVF